MIWGFYLLFVLLMILGWLFNKEVKSSSHLHTLTVVVPFKDEEENLQDLITCLSQQSYPDFEVIFVDDNSEDQSEVIIKNALRETDLKHKVINSLGLGKKEAISNGIVQAKNGIIVTTDADCRMGPKWLERINAAFNSEQIKMVSAPVVLESKGGLFQNWQELEFSSLIGSGGAMINLGIPTMSNGANLAYRKEVFDEVGGFEGITNTPSGDDELLMKKIRAKYPNAIRFLQEKNAVVRTNTLRSWKKFIHQRRRWASKWKVHPRPWTIATAFLIFLFNLVILLTLYAGFSGRIAIDYLFILFGSKLITEFVFLALVSQKIGARFRLIEFITSQIFYPIYALFFGVVANFGKYNWKGRSYQV